MLILCLFDPRKGAALPVIRAGLGPITGVVPNTTYCALLVLAV